MKELQEQLTTVQHEVKQRQLRCQELEEQLKGSHELNAKLQQEADVYCSSVDKLEEELAITRQKHQIAIQEVIVCVCTHAYVCMHACICVHAGVCLCMCVFMHVCVRAYVCVCVCRHVHNIKYLVHMILLYTGLKSQ